MYHLDTDICIAALKGNPAVVKRILERPERIAISSIVLGELYCGVFHSQFVTKNLKALQELVLGVSVIPFGVEEAKI
ncbi:MAG: type II toxin-antitoxin system VapC family toxin [bacterium]